MWISLLMLTLESQVRISAISDPLTFFFQLRRNVQLWQLALPQLVEELYMVFYQARYRQRPLSNR